MNPKSKGRTAKKVKLTPAPANKRGALKHIGGSQSDDWNLQIANDTSQGLWQ
jgi:hypothetical protein